MTDIVLRMKALPDLTNEKAWEVVGEGAREIERLRVEVERLNAIYTSAVKGRADFRDALVVEREKNVRLFKALCNFANPDYWIDESANLQWIGKRHAIDFAQSVLDENK